jgi:catechol 2,3-dioxygenase-like lactoylglutathione lyase family enzyme
VTVPPHMAHFGYDLPSRAAVDEMAARGQAEGLLVQGPTDAGRIVGYLCMLRDPDGNLVEFSYGQPINPKHLR